MKILKIELQNINSLKSDQPIVIDFNGPELKDVGLYAITGATGAGKTTILDAITIALYYSVPRFKNSKGVLLDVVSHGATHAFSRITFENEQTIYEASWYIRLTSSTGKPLTNPTEEVSLKNLTTTRIIASQKRAVIAAVHKVTQLNYDQFLRSVMLAQGEFASFLSAKGADKANLLEQITGEEIYKKIGQGILERKSKEDNKLKEIQSKINSDDILSDPSKIELTKKDKEIDVQITTAEKDLTTIQNIASWHKKSQELDDLSVKLELESREVNTEFENHKTEFELLSLNEKAEPFTTLLQNFTSNKQNSLAKAAQFKELTEQLTALEPDVLKFEEYSKKQSIELKKAEEVFTAWLPQFDFITKIDNELKNEKEKNQRSLVQLEAVKKEITTLQNKKNELVLKIRNTKEKIETDRVYITQHQFLPQVSAVLSNWTTDLTKLKAYKETLLENTIFITDKKKAVASTALELKTTRELFQNKRTQIDKLEKDTQLLTLQLSKNNTTQLLASKEKISTAAAHWKEFKNLSIRVIKEEKELEKATQQRQLLFTELELIKTKIKTFQKDIVTQEQLVIDAQKILDLEISISKYEDDRQRLMNGIPCGLCGSKDHPFTKHLESKGISSSQLEFDNRKSVLQKLNNDKVELDKKEVQYVTSLENLKQQSSTIKTALESIKSAAQELDVDADFNQLEKINTTINEQTAQLKILDDNINSTQKLQTQKEEWMVLINQQNKSIEQLSTKDATLEENIKNNQAEIQAKQIAVDSLFHTTTQLENNLKSRLAQFDYEMPEIATIDSFIKSIEVAINLYHSKQKNIDALKAETTVFTSSYAHIEKQLDAQDHAQKEYTKIISESAARATQFKEQRNSILPIAITVEDKRNSLQQHSKDLHLKGEHIKKELQKLLDLQREKEAIKLENIKEQKLLHGQLISLQNTLDDQIIKSDFNSKEAIEKALLPIEVKKKYIENKKRLEEKQLRVKTLKENNHKAIKDSNALKTFTTSQAESDLALEQLKNHKDGLMALKGEIKESFRKDQEIKTRNQETYKKIVAQEAICKVWKELFAIIGNSQHAFNTYVQRLTLKHLLDLANVHLYQLNKRYSLKMEATYKPKEELNFNLIDHYQTDQARLVDTSSGGEKFIISLALALGLSDLASKNVKIDSLFIDEGFGTLDKNTLETVISTLETLQSQGKMIGIISHVENLKERIPIQIQIIKKSNGISTVQLI